MDLVRLPTTPRVVLTAFPDGVGDLAVVGDGASSLVAQRRGEGDDAWVVLASANPVVNALDYGASGNGVDDNRLVLQNILDGMPSGGVIRFPRGDYGINVKPGVGNANRASVFITGTDVTITGDGPGTRFVFRGAPGGANKVLFGVGSGARRVTFRDCHIVQGDLTGEVDEQTHLVELWAAGDDDIEDVQFHRVVFGTVKGDCIRILGDPSPREVRRVVVSDCTFDGSLFGGTSHPGYGYRAGVSVQRGLRGLDVRGSYFTGGQAQEIDCEPTGSGVVAGLSVRGCTVNHTGPTAAAGVSMGGIGLTDHLCDDLRFVDNVVLNGRVVIRCARRVMVRGNTIKDGPHSASTPVLDMQNRILGGVIEGNIVESNETSGAKIGINLVHDGTDTPSTVLIRGNVVQFHVGPGIQVQSSPSTTVTDNDVRFAGSSTNQEIGIQLRATVAGMPGALVMGNRIDGSDGGGTLQRGISVNPSNPMSGVAIVGNSIRGCVTGIQLMDGNWSDQPVVAGNTVVGATVPVNFGSQTPVVSGNAGSRALYTGSAVDPSTLPDFGAIGSGYISGNGQHYIKTAAGASGWKLVTHV